MWCDKEARNWVLQTNFVHFCGKEATWSISHPLFCKKNEIIEIGLDVEIMPHNEKKILYAFATWEAFVKPLIIIHISYWRVLSWQD